MLRLGIPVPMHPGHHALKWGMSEDELTNVLREHIDVLSTVRLGIGIHWPRNRLTEDRHVVEIVQRHFSKFAQTISEHGLTVSFLDVGGGIDWRGQHARRALRILDGQLGAQEIWMEPGRFLVQDAFTMECHVLDVRERGSETLVYLNASIYDGLLDIAILGMRPRLRFFGPHDCQMIHARVVGHTSDPRDDLGTFRVPATIKRGDKVELLSIGAYSLDLVTSFGRGIQIRPATA